MLNGGTHTVVGNGADIWAANDEFRFTHQQLTGDGTITARLVTFTGTGTINANAKAGVMIRRSLAANSAHVLACLPVQGQATQVKAIKREATGNATSVSQTGGTAGFPRWVRVTRVGTTLTAYQSTNGTTFTQLGTPTSVSGMTGTVFVGMAVTSHVDGTNYTATFDSVTVTTPMPQPPGPPTNLACTAGNGQCACSWTAPRGRRHQLQPEAQPHQRQRVLAHRQQPPDDQLHRHHRGQRRPALLRRVGEQRQRRGRELAARSVAPRSPRPRRPST